MHVTLISKNCCPPCETTNFLIKKILYSRLNITYSKIILNSTNKANIFEKYNLAKRNITEYDVPIVLINNDLYSKQFFKESDFVLFLNNYTNDNKI